MCVMAKQYKRTVLITGATDGIGRQVALELAAKCDENFVIIHGRCKQKCEATVNYLISENKRLSASPSHSTAAAVHHGNYPNNNNNNGGSIRRQPHHHQHQHNHHHRRHRYNSTNENDSGVDGGVEDVPDGAGLPLRGGGESGASSSSTVSAAPMVTINGYDDGNAAENCAASSSCNGSAAGEGGEDADWSNLSYVAADFAHVSEICRMAEEVKRRFPRLNTLISCASILVPRKMSSHDGVELTLQVNHLSHFILWNALLPLLECNAPARILTVGSMLHSFNSIDWTDVRGDRPGSVYDKFQQYSRSKLMNHLATFYIHRLLFKHNKQFQVTANVVDADQQADPRISRCYANFSSVLSASESHLNSHANGILTLVRLVENPEYSTMSGKYFDANGREVRLNAEVGDVRLQDRLWESSRELCMRLKGREAAALMLTPISVAAAAPVPKIVGVSRRNHHHHHHLHHRANGGKTAESGGHQADAEHHHQ